MTELVISLVRIKPARLIGFVKCCKVHNILRTYHVDKRGFGSNIIHWKKTVTKIAREAK